MSGSGRDERESTQDQRRPPWLDRVVSAAGEDLPEWFATYRPPAHPDRRSAVLILFGPHPGGGVDVVLTERSQQLRAHAGQVSFPGGQIDEADDGSVDAALREAEEEVGIVPDSVEVVGTLPEIYLGPSGNAVTPVLGWWRDPGPIGVVDAGEVAAVVRVPLADIINPRDRFTATHPSGYAGPAFEVHGLFVWGFTASLLSTVLDVAGISEPWDATVTRPLPQRIISAWMRSGS